MQGFDEILDRDLPLASRTYYRIGGVSERFYRPRRAAEAADLLRVLEEAGEGWRVLGGGANLLIEDGVHRVPIIATESLLGTSYESEGDVVLLRAGAGESFPRLVAETVRRGLAGFEGLAGIPGFVGGICAMNAEGATPKSARSFRASRWRRRRDNSSRSRRRNSSFDTAAASCRREW